MMKHSNFMGKYITKVFPPKMREVGGKRQKDERGDKLDPLDPQKKRARATAQALLTQAFSGLTF
jgi:hypothetical protein